MLPLQTKIFFNIVKKSILFILFLIVSISAFSQANNEQLAYQYFRNQEYDKAVELFAELYKRNPNSHFYTYYLQTLLQLGDTQEAEKLVKKQMKQSPNVQKYGVDLGNVYELQGETSKAKKQYENSIQAIEANSPLIIELAQAFQSYRLNDYAVKTFLHGRTLSKEPAIYAAEIAAIYETNGNYDKAMGEYLLVLLGSENMLNFVQTRLTNWLLSDEGNMQSEIIRVQTLKAIGKYPDNKAYNSLMIWFSMQKKDFSAALKQAKAMDKRYNEDGKRIFDMANIAVENQDFNTAIDAYNYIIGRGETTVFYYDARTMLLNTKLTQAIAEYPSLRHQVVEIDKDLTDYFQSKPIYNSNFNLYRRWISLKAVQLQDIESARKMIEENRVSNNIGNKEKALLKLDLGDILQLENDVWEATLLYSQVEKDFPNDTIGHLAKFKNAKLSFHIGEFEWAKAQLDVLRAATSKLIANDAMYFSLLISDNQDEEGEESENILLKQFAHADFLMEVHRYDEALQIFDSIEQYNVYHSLLDDILYRKAQIAVIQNQYTKADSLYESLVAYYSQDLLADEALFERAKLQEIHFKDPFKAMELYQQLFSNYLDSIYVIDSRKRFRELRGDILNTGN